MVNLYINFRMKIQLVPLQSSISLFDGGGGGHGHVPPKYSGLHGHFKRSPSTNSNLSAADLRR